MVKELELNDVVIDSCVVSEQSEFVTPLDSVGTTKVAIGVKRKLVIKRQRSRIKGALEKGKNTKRAKGVKDSATRRVQEQAQVKYQSVTETSCPNQDEMAYQPDRCDIQTFHQNDLTFTQLLLEECNETWNTIVGEKNVVAEETQLKLVEYRLHSNSQTVIPHHHEVEVGLVIGKLSTSLDRGFIFDLIPTPNNEAAQPPCSLLPVNNPTKQRSSSSSSSKGGGGLKSSNIPSSLLIDTDWVSEHARQVSRLLLGGINVIGLYVYVNDTVFKNSTILLSQTLKTLAQTSSSSTNDETLLIHISYAPIRWTCRTCVTSSSTLRPCDFKMGRLLKSLQTYKCIYNFHITFPIYIASASKHKTFSQILRDAISSHLKELKGAVVLIDGKPVMEDETCNSDALHEVEFLLPFMKDAFSVDLGSQKDVAGVIVFRGSICSFTFMNPKEPISQVLTDIRDDISSSLQSRLDIICDEAEGELYSTPDADNNPSSDIATEKPTPQIALQLLSKHCDISFPRRVFIPWLPGTFICDYLQQAETVEILKDHFVELMSMEAPTDVSTILELEREAPTVTTKSFWEVSNLCSDAHSPDVIKKSDNRSIIKDSMQNPIKSINIVGAIIFLLLSIIVGVALLLVKRA